MKIVLIKPYSNFPTRIPHLGLGYLAASLLEQGHAVEILDCPRENLDARLLAERTRMARPDLLGISLFSSDLPAARAIARQVRRDLPGTPLVLGGPHPTVMPGQTLDYIPEADYVLAGEAEESLPRLAAALAGKTGGQASIPGLAWREGGRVRSNPPVLPADLDNPGRPAWHLLQPALPSLAPHGAFLRSWPAAPLITTRGCPFPCTFCAGRSISGRRIRTRSLEGILEEIDYLQKDFGIREIHFEDDNFTFDPERTALLCEALLRRPVQLHWCCPNGVRLDTLTTGLLRLMRRAGCYSLALGIESGSDAVLRRIRKQLRTGQIREQVELIRASGIKTTGFFILGFPGETAAEIRETIRFALALPLDRAQFSTFLPLPGTEYFDSYLQQVPLDQVPWDHFFTTDVIYAPEGLTVARMIRMQRQAFLRFYIRPRILGGLLTEIRSPRQIRHLLARALAVLK